VKPIGPNFRRFVSPTDPGDVVVPSVKRRQPSHQSKDGARPLKVPLEHPPADWMRNRTLHHFPHEALAHRLGWAAFALLVLLMALAVSMLILANHGGTPTWVRVISFFAGALCNVCGIFSQVLSGGRCWIGAMSMAMVWIILILTMVVGLV